MFRRIGLLTTALLFPTLFTVVYFVWLADAPTLVQQIAYAFGKAAQFILIPWAIVAFAAGAPLEKGPPRWTRGILSAGVLSGLAIGLAIALPALFWLIPSGMFDAAAATMRIKLSGFGLTTPVRFALLALFYAVFHSGLEEYYWRWLVDRQLRPLCGWWGSLAISSLGFTAHHVVIVATYLGWDNPWTYWASLAVGLGGAIWAVLDRRQGTIAGAWLSHGIVDAIIFAVGWKLLN